ncbi:MAG: MotA/TolQ/ExbB proton channel family protein [Gammaproteobacteria bacterium]
MYELILSGGWFIWPLLVCSILMVSIIIERIWLLQKKLVVPDNLLKQVVILIENNKFTIQQQESFIAMSHLGSMLSAIFRQKDSAREVLESKAEEKAEQIRFDLERNINNLGIIASIAPLLGLLGTVVGMIKVFANLESLNESNNANLLALGISEALITTAVGLLVAVPALTAFHIFNRKVEHLMVLIQAESSKLIDYLGKK